MKRYAKIIAKIMRVLLTAALCTLALSAEPVYAAITATYYSSGNIETVTEDDTIYTFLDEDYYSYYVDGDPSHSHGQGRLSKYEHENPDGSVEYSTFEYYHDTLNICRVKKPFYDSSGIVPGVELEDRFYDENFILNPRVAIDSQGSTFVSSFVLADDLQREAYVVKYNPLGEVLWRRELAINTFAVNVVCDVDGSDNVYVACTMWREGLNDNDVVVYKYSSDGTPLDIYERDLGGFETITDIVVDPPGNAYISGTTGDWPNQGVFIIKVIPSLDEAWFDVYNTAYKDSGGYLSMDRFGNILSRGYSQDHPTYQHFKISYTPSGVKNSVSSDELQMNQPRINLGCWTTGRRYAQVRTENEESTLSISLGFRKDTGISIFQYIAAGEIDYFPVAYGGISGYVFIDPATNIDVGFRGRFTNGIGAEVLFGDGENGFYITKVTGYDANTYWFLWDVEYDGQPHQYIAIKKTPQDEYYAYTFDDEAENFEALMQGLVEIGPVADPDLLELPELGDWWQWAAQNHIVPVFPPLSSDITYDGMHRVVLQIDHNPYSPDDPNMDTTYTYSWDTPAAGEVEMTMSYDYDRDGDQDLIYSAVYENGTDYDLFNITQWELISENFHFAEPDFYSLNMIEMPWYENVADYFSTGAATCQMILNYIREGAGASLFEGSEGQDEIYRYAKDPLPYGPELTPDEVDNALGHFDPYDSLVSNGFDGYDSRLDGNPYQGYNYTVDTYDSALGPDAINEYMRDICHWMAYTVTQENWWDNEVLVARPNTPAAVPIYGSYANWVAVKGCVTSENPCPEPHTNPWNSPDFAVYGFWIKDPQVTGIGQNTYKTAAECRSTYFLPLVTDDAYDGLFLQVAEPPAEISNASVGIPNPTTDLANLEFIGVKPATKGSRESNPLMAMSLGVASRETSKPLIKKQSWKDLIDLHLLIDPEAVAAFENTKMGKPILVDRQDAGADYYLVPFGKRIKGKFLASAVMILDASAGYFKEASWTDKPEDLFKVSKEKAFWLVEKSITKDFLKELRDLPKRPIKTYLLRQRELLREYTRLLRNLRGADIVLVWDPNGYSPSPYKPYWKIDVNGSIWYVTQAQKVIRAD